ncbi:CD74 molecule, major histocompatibility complex, class II invariant chain a [Anguilla rostrata]|uniref:CD74 molecule, major histocompatibility complex, class II invariant chain a n=1 Tax=Anguilla rostrata TaxID=7938 RepID=UPI0030D391B3
MADQQDASLLERSESQGSVDVVRNTRSRSSDLKIAGAIFLVCMLIAGQGLTAYFVINQKDQIGSLEKTADLLKIKLTQASRGSSGKMVRMPVYSAPLMTMDFSDADTKKKPLVKLENTVMVSLEKQVKDLLKTDQLPQFNETFMANLQALKDQSEESEWKEFESWMRHWLVFQMAQHPAPTPVPATTPPSASKLQTKCQLEATRKIWLGNFRPQCDEQGNYLPRQCWHSTGYCWCVDKDGVEIPNTAIRGMPQCGGMPVDGRMMAMPSLTKLMKDDDTQ